ncbi:MAG: DUF2723 domain-containing protein [candidate division Zixibacteria bacterium]|nr:DUF2723 domain-containing protein [candidate division Zixibacteria bacterium]
MTNFQSPGLSFYLALAAIALGFVCLRQPPVDGLLSLTLAPVLLVLGFVFLIPAGMWPSMKTGRRRTALQTYLFRIKQPVNQCGLLVFLFSFLIYILTLWPAPGWWDSSEYISVSYMLGVTGAPGSMLLQLLGRLFSFLVLIPNPAVRINILTALITSAAAMTVYFTVVRLNVSFVIGDRENKIPAVMGGILAALALAFCHSVWNRATYTNPYALSLLTGALMVYLAVRWWEKPDIPGAGNWLLLIGFLFGLDFSVHRSNTLLAPAFLALVLIYRPKMLLDFRLWLGGLVFFLLGLSLQMAVMLRSMLEPQLNVSDVGSWTGLWHYLNLKQQGLSFYGSRLLERNGPFWSCQLRDTYLRYLGWNFIGFDSATAGVKFLGTTGIPALVGIVGIVYHFMRNRKQALFFIVLFLFASLGAVFFLNAPENFFREMDRHFMASYLVVAIWVGLGICALLRLARRWFARRPELEKIHYSVYAVILAVILPLNMLIANWTNNDMSDNYSAYNYGYNILQSCEPNAVLYTAGDNDTFMPWYLQIIEGVRTDVTVINQPLSNTTWYLRSLMTHQSDMLWTLTADSLAAIQPTEWPTDTVAIARYDDSTRSIDIVVQPTIADRYILPQDRVLLNLLRENHWRQPLYFTTGFGQRLPFNLADLTRLDGLVWLVTPDDSARADISRLVENILYNYRYEGVSGVEFYDKTLKSMMNMYYLPFGYLAQYYKEQGDEKNLKRLQNRFDELWPELGGLEKILGKQ